MCTKNQMLAKELRTIARTSPFISNKSVDLDLSRWHHCCFERDLTPRCVCVCVRARVCVGGILGRVCVCRCVRVSKSELGATEKGSRGTITEPRFRATTRRHPFNLHPRSVFPNRPAIHPFCFISFSSSLLPPHASLVEALRPPLSPNGQRRKLTNSWPRRRARLD